MAKNQENRYVIDGYYDFGTVADGVRPSACGENGLHLQYEHDEVMEMGEFFYEEDPCEIDIDYNFGIKDELDSILLDSIIEDLRAEWEKEQEEQERSEREWYEKNREDCDEGFEFERDEEPDFEMLAYDSISMMYHCWDEQFKQDCIDYYLAHKEDD